MASKRIDRTALAEVIRNLDGISNDQRADLLQLLNDQKRYGLVWEEHTENAEEKLREQLPVLKEVEECRILSDDAESPNHILIEVDNLHALTALTYTHEGKVDVIYIDPPYNTGNKDFIYNDSFVDAEDGYRHSKWLSFMSKRLRIAKKLLSDKGVIFISIDDNEQANLKLLCDEVFGEKNCVAILPTIMNLKGNQDEYGFAGTHEYSIVYTKIHKGTKFGEFDIDESELEKWQEDNVGYFKKGATLKRTGEDAPREQRPWSYFPILVDNTTWGVSVISEDEYDKIYDDKTKKFDDEWITSLESKYKSLGYSFLLPYNDNIKTSWRWSYQKVKDEKDEIIVIKGRSDFSLYKKQRPELDDLPSKKPKSIFYKAKYSSGNGTTSLLEILGEKKFSNPKPIDLISDFLQISTTGSSLILDFFAGSGTTLHATMQLNAEDGGKRQCILVTNNENKICEEVTYERNKRVINGYTTPKGEQVEGLKSNNLRYYKVDFVERDSSVNAKKKLMEASTELLCIKQDLYVEKQTFGSSIKLNSRYARYFDDGKKQMLVIYNTDAIESLVAEIEKMSADINIMTYVFSTNNYALDADFEDVADKVTLCALPAAIYNAYFNVLPKKVTPKTEEDETETIPGE